MPDPASPESPTPPSQELPPLSQIGALSGRFVHDLANDLASASTLAALISETAASGTTRKEDLDDLQTALQRAVVAIHHFGAAVRGLRPSPREIPLTHVIESIQATLKTHSQLSLKTADVPPQAIVIANTEWLNHCIHFLANELTADNPSATIELALLPAAQVTPPPEYYALDKPTHYVAITFPFTDDTAALAIESSTVENNLPALAVKELLRHMRGFLLRPNTGSLVIYLASLLQGDKTSN